MDLRDLILSQDDTKKKSVKIPEWTNPETKKPLTVYIKAMTGPERLAWSNSAFDDKGETVEHGMYSRLLVHCLVDAEGKKIFTEADIDALEQKHGGVLVRLFVMAKRLNGLLSSSVDDAEKNSETSPS